MAHSRCFVAQKDPYSFWSSVRWAIVSWEFRLTNWKLIRMTWKKVDRPLNCTFILLPKWFKWHLIGVFFSKACEKKTKKPKLHSHWSTEAENTAKKQLVKTKYVWERFSAFSGNSTSRSWFYSTEKNINVFIHENRFNGTVNDRHYPHHMLIDTQAISKLSKFHFQIYDMLLHEFQRNVLLHLLRIINLYIFACFNDNGCEWIRCE